MRRVIKQSSQGLRVFGSGDVQTRWHSILVPCIVQSMTCVSALETRLRPWPLLTCQRWHPISRIPWQQIMLTTLLFQSITA